MADLYRVFGITDETMQLETDYCDPIRMVRDFYDYTQASREIEQYDKIESLFEKFEDELWEYRCKFTDLLQIKAYLEHALNYLKQISDEVGNIQEPYRTRFLEIDQPDLWECGFFFWKKEDQIKPREFIPQVSNLIEFIDKAITCGSDLLLRTDD